jgi:hypothetical protein
MCWTVGSVQETTVNRQMLETPEVPVLRLDLRRVNYHGLSLVIRVYDADPNVVSIVFRVFRRYNRAR